MFIIIMFLIFIRHCKEPTTSLAKFEKHTCGNWQIIHKLVSRSACTGYQIAEKSAHINVVCCVFLLLHCIIYSFVNIFVKELFEQKCLYATNCRISS